MRRNLSFIAVLAMVLTLTACQKEYRGEDVLFGDNRSTAESTVERLENNNIPYRMEDERKIFIPEDAYDDAIACCT